MQMDDLSDGAIALAAMLRRTGHVFTAHGVKHVGVCSPEMTTPEFAEQMTAHTGELCAWLRTRNERHER
jgi:hypothetical protein